LKNQTLKNYKTRLRGKGALLFFSKTFFPDFLNSPLDFLKGNPKIISYSLFFILGHVSGGRVTVTDGNYRIYYNL
jgi:hypothetical protein